MREAEHLFRQTGNPDYRSQFHQDISRENLRNQSGNLSPDWYRDSVFYQVWVKSFSDSNGDGVGDIQGIINRLDYIQNETGCDAIWLSPVFECGFMTQSKWGNMHGYDTVDYYNINALFGSRQNLEELIQQVHSRGMKIIFDYVPNHTSRMCSWFRDSEQKINGREDWYMWAPKRYKWTPIGGIFRNTWVENRTRSLLKDKNRYAYGAFGGFMPDLNYRNCEVREEMQNVVRYWLNCGFDGIRVDAARYLIENPGKGNQRDTQETHDYFALLQKNVISEYQKLGVPKMMVGEAWVENDRPKFNRYFGTSAAPEFNMLFDFDFTKLVQKAVLYKKDDLFKAVCRDSQDSSLPQSARLAYMLCNHDDLASFPATVYSDRRQLRLAHALHLLSPATPFVYNGSEFGQKDAFIPGPFTDMKLRFPADWNLMQQDASKEDSILRLHRQLIGLRRQHIALRRGRAEYYSDGRNTYGWILTYRNPSDETCDEVLKCTFNLEDYSFSVYKLGLNGLEEKLI